LKLSQMVGPQIEENLSEYEPDWLIGGVTATKSTKLLITPRPSDLVSRSLHHCDPWLKTDKIFTKIYEHVSEHGEEACKVSWRSDHWWRYNRQKGLILIRCSSTKL